jgi:hypothetical protein
MKTIARVYDNYGQAGRVVADPETFGISPGAIELIANRHACEVDPYMPTRAELNRMREPYRWERPLG